MKFFKGNTNILFLLVICYIFAAFAWWAFLLLQKSETEFALKVELYELKNENSTVDFEDSAAYLELDRQRKGQYWMILGEGFVFLLLLLFGAWRISLSFRKELSLAQQKNNFLLSITHELKSPLASIRLSLETLLKRLNAEEIFQRLMRNSLQDVDRLSSLVDNILLAARMENKSYPFQREQLNFSEILQKSVNTLAENIGAKHSFETRIEENIYVQADRMALNALLLNLLENAIKYSPEGSPIKIVLAEKNKTILLEISDKGIGIPQADKSQIFKKFYRIGNEDTRKTKGTGLGLYIVQNIAQQMKGKIEVLDNAGGGALFRISFQKKESNG